MFSDIPGRTVSLNVPGADTTPISPSLSTEDTASRDTSDTHDNEFVSERDDSDEQPVDDDTNNSDEEEDDSDEGGIETESDKTDQVNDEATEESDKSNDEKDVSDEEEDEEEEEEEDEEKDEEEKDEEEKDEEEKEKEVVGKEVVGKEVEEKPEETDVVDDDTDESGIVEDVEDVEDVEEEEPEGASRTSTDTIDAHLASLRNELEQLHKHTQTIDQQSELQDKDMVTLDITLDRMNDKLESACACANGRYNKDLNTCQVDVTEKMLRLVKAVVSKPTNTPDAARKQEAFARHAPAFVYSDPSVRASMVKPLAEKLFTVLLSGDGPMVNTRITAVQVPLSQRSRLSRRRRPSCCSGASSSTASPFQRAMQSLSTGCDRQCSCRSRNGPANNIPTYTLPSVSPTSLSSSITQPASPVWIVRSIPSTISSSTMPSSASVSTSSRARRRSFKNKSKNNRKRVSTKMSKSKSKSKSKRVSNRRSSATSSSVARKPSRSPGRSTATKRKRRASQRGGSIRAHSRMIPAAGTVPNVRYVMDAQGSAPVAMTPTVQGGQTFVFPATATPACAVPTMYPATMTANTVPTAIQQTGGGNGNGSRPLMDVQGQYGCTSAAQQGGQVMVFPTTATPVCAVPGQCGGPVGVRGGGRRRQKRRSSSRRTS